MLGWEFPPFNSGGLGVACQHLAEALADRGVNISFLLPWRVNAHSDKMKLIFADDATVLQTYRPFMSGYITSAEYARLTLEERALIDNDLTAKVLNYAHRARKIVSQKRFDLLHAHDWLTFKAGIAGATFSGLPLLAHVHSTEYDRCGGKGYGNEFCQAVEYEMMHKADHVIAVSDYTKRILRQEYQVNPHKVSVVHNGTIFPDQTTPNTSLDGLMHLKKAGYKLVAYTGRFTLHKGVDYFIKAAEITLKYQPRTYFILAGSGEMESHLINLVASLGMSQKFLFTGFLRGEKLQRLYQMIDLLVLPSVSEPFGMTPLEALVYKTPVIISRQSGVREVLPNSLMIDYWDVEEMANQMVAVLKFNSLKNTLGDNGSTDVRKNTWARAAEKVTRIYQSLLTNRPVLANT